MNVEQRILEKKSSKDIILKYPELFGEPPFDMMKTLIGFGFECGYGWYPILEELFEKMHRYVTENDLNVKVVQVKEKFGGLRVYCHGHDDKTIRDMIREAENKAEVTCETCGKPGTLSTNGWWKVTCDEHKNS